MEFAKPDLENEYVASKTLKGIMWPKSYIVLRENFCKIHSLEAIPEINSIIIMLQKSLLTPSGLLKDNKLEDFYKGKSEDLYKLLQYLFQISVDYENTYSLAVKGKLQAEMARIELVANTMSNTAEYAETIDKVNSEQMFLKQLDAIHYTLILNQNALAEILDIYGTGLSIPKKGKYSGYSEEYQFYLDDLYRNFIEEELNPEITRIVYQAIDAITQMIPRDNLDPFKLDQCKNLIDVLQEPDSFYIKCKNEEIQSSNVGSMFTMIYPGYTDMYLDMYMEEYEHMDLQAQINFRKCFNLIENVGELVSSVSSMINLGFVPIQPAQPVKKGK